jgi:hypothetical protein
MYYLMSWRHFVFVKLKESRAILQFWLIFIHQQSVEFWCVTSFFKHMGYRRQGVESWTSCGTSSSKDDISGDVIGGTSTIENSQQDVISVLWPVE